MAEPAFAVAQQPPYSPAAESPPPAVDTTSPEPSPWNSDMPACPRDGRLVVLTEDLSKPDGIRCVRYTMRGQARPWAKAPVGWLDVSTRRFITFEPTGWALP